MVEFKESNKYEIQIQVVDEDGEIIVRGSSYTDDNFSTEGAEEELGKLERFMVKRIKERQCS